MCVRAGVHVCMLGCGRSCMCVGVGVRVCVRVGVHVCVRVGIHVCVLGWAFMYVC
jgi:hypothetical protein